MRLISSIILFLIVILVLNTFNLSLYTEISALPESPAYNSEIGSFQLYNTSEQKTLFEFYSMGMGQSYNVTTHLHTNSSSGVSFSIFHESGINIEGVKMFTLAPNETRTETYVSHWASDGVPLRKALYLLVEGTKNASGSYQVQKVHEGYDIDVGFGETYIANITEWLYSVSLTTSRSSTNSFSSIEWFVGAFLCILYFRRKKHPN